MIPPAGASSATHFTALNSRARFCVAGEPALLQTAADGSPAQGRGRSCGAPLGCCQAGRAPVGALGRARGPKPGGNCGMGAKTLPGLDGAAAGSRHCSRRPDWRARCASTAGCSTTAASPPMPPALTLAVAPPGRRRACPSADAPLPPSGATAWHNAGQPVAGRSPATGAAGMALRRNRRRPAASPVVSAGDLSHLPARPLRRRLRPITIPPLLYSVRCAGRRRNSASPITRCHSSASICGTPTSCHG